MDTMIRPSDKIKNTSLIIRTSAVQQPNVLGFYSSKIVSETEEEIHLDASNCKYLKKQLLAQQNLQIDLKDYDDLHDEYQRNLGKYSKLYNPMRLFLDYLRESVSKETFVKSSANKIFDVDFICSVQVLTKLMMVHGDFNETFTLYCTKYRGNIYITKKNRTSFKQEPFKYIARHAFFADNPRCDENTDVPYMTNFHCVFDRKLGNSKLMYFAGVDGVDSDAEINSATDLSKIKFSGTTVIFKDSEENKNAANITAFWWCELLMRGNAEAHLLRFDDEQCVKSVNAVDANHILRENENRWRKSSSDRLSFLSLMLDFIKLRMGIKCVDCPLTVYEFHFNPKTQRTVHYKIHSGLNEYTFLTDQYVNAVKGL